MTWITISRPGQTGAKKQQVQEQRNRLYGVGNWRQAWEYEGVTYTQPDVFKICEESYYEHALRHTDQWQELLRVASDIFDYSEQEIVSGTDYTKQLSYTRFHDICIRNVVKRRGWVFTGTTLVQIRWDAKNQKPFFDQFDPGRIPFHTSDAIIKPSLKGFWEENSVEDFYQSNKVLQIKK